MDQNGLETGAGDDSDSLGNSKLGKTVTTPPAKEKKKPFFKKVRKLYSLQYFSLKILHISAQVDFIKFHYIIKRFAFPEQLIFCVFEVVLRMEDLASKFMWLTPLRQSILSIFLLHCDTLFQNPIT